MGIMTLSLRSLDESADAGTPDPAKIKKPDVSDNEPVTVYRYASARPDAAQAGGKAN